MASTPAIGASSHAQASSQPSSYDLLKVAAQDGVVTNKELIAVISRANEVESDIMGQPHVWSREDARAYMSLADATHPQIKKCYAERWKGAIDPSFYKRIGPSTWKIELGENTPVYTFDDLYFAKNYITEQTGLLGLGALLLGYELGNSCEIKNLPAVREFYRWVEDSDGTVPKGDSLFFLDRLNVKYLEYTEKMEAHRKARNAPLPLCTNTDPLAPTYFADYNALSASYMCRYGIEESNAEE